MYKSAIMLVSILIIIGSFSILSENIEIEANPQMKTRGNFEWSMDMKVNEVSLASFIGEATDDCSGIIVSGAGDVNGDGYDDILIGAYQNDEGGTDAGQTYLILGKSTGWNMDIGLSSADASFIGEAAGDILAVCSGAGDVNGDGYDDILIGSIYNDEGGADRRPDISYLRPIDRLEYGHKAVLSGCIVHRRECR